MAESVFNKRRWKFFVALLVLCAVAAVAVGIGMHYYIGHGTDASDLAEVMPDSLVVGARFSLADMLESEGYTYGWTKDAVDVEVLVRTRPAGGQSVMSEEEGELSAQSGLLAYDAEEREFRVLGVGEGVLNIVNPVDDTVRIEIPFSTRFANSDTAEIFEANFPEADDDGFITAEEIAAVKILTIAEGGTFEVGEFDVFPELQSVVLTADGVSTLRGAAELDGVTYRGAGRGAHLHLRCGRRHRRHFDVCANPPRLYIHGLVRERRQRRDPRGRSRGQGHRLHLGHQTLRGLARQ